MADLWEATLGAGNITYKALSSPQHPDNDSADDDEDTSKTVKGPAARKGHCAVVVHDASDPYLVSASVSRQQQHCRKFA